MMDIEMIFDPIEMAVQDGLCLDERHHICVESQWLRAVKRTTGRDDLFVYYHKETNNFVLAQWIYSPEKDGVAICVELEVMEEAPDRGGWISLEYIKKRCAKGDDMVKELKNKMKTANSIKQSEKEELLEKRTAAADYFRKKGKRDIAASIETGPYAQPKQSTLDTLNGGARNRIITSG